MPDHKGVDTEPRGFGCRFFQISAGARAVIEQFLERSGAAKG